MKAVYQCEENPYLTLSLDEVVPLVDTYEDGNGSAVVLWVRRRVPQALQFVDGMLILTDPVEIQGMREYIKRRQGDFISELSFEGDEAELAQIVHIKPLYPTEPQEGSETPQRGHGIDRSSEREIAAERRLRIAGFI